MGQDRESSKVLVLRHIKAIEKDSRPEGILDDIRDLRRYLLLVEQHMLEEMKVERRKKE